MTAFMSPTNLAGALPGAAEQDAGDEVGPAAGPGRARLKRGAHVRSVHVYSQKSDGSRQQREDEAERGTEEHARPGGGLQTQVHQEPACLQCHYVQPL